MDHIDEKLRQVLALAHALLGETHAVVILAGALDQASPVRTLSLQSEGVQRQLVSAIHRSFERGAAKVQPPIALHPRKG